MKILISVFVLAISITSCNSSSSKINKEYDTRAIATLDSLSSSIGELKSCSFSVNTKIKNGNKLELSNQHDVYMRGPDKMHIHTEGTKGEKGYWYDGKQLAFLNYDKSTFDTISSPDNIISTIDFIHNEYGVDFPAADFFYPSLTDDVINNYNKVLYIGDKTIDNVKCIAISANNDNENIYLWINSTNYLPYKMIIEKVGESTSTYEGNFSNWRINPHLPDLLFEFTPRSTSTRVELISKK